MLRNIQEDIIQDILDLGFNIDIVSMQNDREFAINLSEIIFLRSIVLSFYDKAITRTKDLYNNINNEL